MAVRRMKLLKVMLVGVIAAFALAATYISTLVLQRQDALRQVWRYNTAWLASQAVVEFMRFEQRVSAFAVQGSGVDLEEVQLRLDILLNRLKLLKTGEFDEFIRNDPERQQTIHHLGAALSAVQPLIEDLGQPGAVKTALDMLVPLDAQLVALASTANRIGGDRVAEDQHELIRLHWYFTSLAIGLILFGAALVVLLMRRNHLLGRAHDEVQRLAGNLQRTSDDLAEANRAVRTANVELRLRNQHFDAALNNMAQGLAMFDRDLRLIVCNNRYYQVMEHAPALVKPGVALREIVEHAVAAGRHRELTVDDIMAERMAVIEEGRPARLQVRLGADRIVETNYRPMPEGGWVVTYDDITERRRAEAQIAYMAHHDALTGLANRVLFREHVEQALSRARRYGERFAVLCLDLDRFKDVNDTLGHPVGDALLKAVAGRLRACLRDADVVARLGGDEFAILQSGAGQTAGVLAGRIVETLAAPFDLDGHHVVIGASVGVALVPGDGADPDQLIKNADMALYRAKADGRGAYRFFEHGMDARLQERRALEVDLRKALGQGEFELFYQPLVNLSTNRVSSFEALLRWRHPDRGLVSPVAFIPLAEETGLIVPIGEWVLRQACLEAARWPDSIKVAVNLSPVQFKSRQLLQAVVGALASSGLAPGRLELEITESVLLQDNEATLATLHQLRELGVRVAMDDFGTGYSSLSYLLSFPFDKIKIDRSFVRDVSERADCATIVHSVASLGASLGMSTTAEGVETREQLELLRAAGCTEVQGFYFDKPKPAGEIELLRNAEVCAAA